MVALHITVLIGIGDAFAYCAFTSWIYYNVKYSVTYTHSIEHSAVAFVLLFLGLLIDDFARNEA